MRQQLLKTEVYHYLKYLMVNAMGKVKITQSRSDIKRPETQQRTLRALGLGKVNKSVEVELTPQIAGMINKVNHLITVQEL